MLEINKIYCMDCIEGMKLLDDESVDFVFTDPPFGIGKKVVKRDETLDEYYKALPEIYRILKENTWFVSFASISRVFDMVKKNPFEYVWLGCIYYSNREKIMHCPIGRSIQSLFLVFKKGNPKISHYGKDVIRYVWNKRDFPKIRLPTAPKALEPIKRLVYYFTKEGDLVVDPFVGGGATAVACKSSGRNFIGFDINLECVEYARSWLLEVPKTLREVFV